MKGTIKTLSTSGHDTVEYDTEAGVVEEAEKVLRDAVYNQAALFDGSTRERIPSSPRAGTTTPSGESQGEMNRRILEEHEEVIVLPPMAGG